MPEWVIQPKTIVVIGASAGGPRVLRTLFQGMPRLRAGVIVVQHMPRFINDSLRDSLAAETTMRVVLARNGDAIENGTVYVAPSEVHLVVRHNRTIRLAHGEKVNYVCPAVDVTMNSLAMELGASFVGVVMTGMGRDGADGVMHVKRIGGVTLAQDEATSSIFGMPKEAIETGCVDFVLPPDAIRRKIVDIVGVDETPAEPKRGMR
jgi:two-component system, chemotaxis family, protein-glutamate methylesterase/glutaminase